MDAHPPPLPPRASTPPPSQGIPLTTPSGAPAALTTSLPSAKAPPRKLWVGLLAVGAVLLGLGAAYLAFALRPAPRPTAKTNDSSSNTDEGSAAPTSSSFSLGDIAVTGEETDGAMAGTNHLASCVAAHLPKDTFRKAPDVSWLCTEKDPRTGGERLRVATVQGAAGGAPTQAMRAFHNSVGTTCLRSSWFETAVAPTRPPWSSRSPRRVATRWCRSSTRSARR